MRGVRLLLVLAVLSVTLIGWPSSAQFPFPECSDSATGVVQIESVVIAASPDAPTCSTIIPAFETRQVSVEVISFFLVSPPRPPPPLFIPTSGPGIVGGRVSVVDEFGQSLGAAECGPTLGSCFATFQVTTSFDQAIVTCETWTLTVATSVAVLPDVCAHGPLRARWGRRRSLHFPGTHHNV